MTQVILDPSNLSAMGEMPTKKVGTRSNGKTKMESSSAPVDGVTYRLWPFWAQSSELAKVTNSMVLATKAHEGQFRKYNGLPYVTHPMRVAFALATYPTVKIPHICAAMLHDTLEDTKITHQEIIDAAGDEALNLVIELTNTTHDLKKIPRRDRKRLDWERLSKVSFWAKIIKMFDRIDNLRDMVNAQVGFKKLYVEESLELLKVVGDADLHIAAQVAAAGKALYDWRDFHNSELLGKQNGTEIESARHGIGYMTSVVKDGQDVKLMVFKERTFEITSSPQNEFRLMRETGQWRDSF